jgi:outer membrane protein assembly factor BamB
LFKSAAQPNFDIVVKSKSKNGQNKRMRKICLMFSFVLALSSGGEGWSAEQAGSVRMAPLPGDGAERYWPQWRGPTRQGLAKGSGYPDRWSDEENVRWRVAVPGQGHSSPIVWGGKLFLTTGYNGDEDRRSVLCFRRSDGKLLWETDVPHEAEGGRIHRANTYASGTPATDGERVYAYFGNHGLMAVDFDGKVVWHDPMGEMPVVHHGPGGSPILYEEMVILFQESVVDNGSFLAAWDRKTGELRWRIPRSENFGWGTPIVIRLPSRDELIVSSQDKLRAYNPGNGELLWECEGNPTEVVPTPVVGHGLIFASSGSWSRHKPTLAVRPGGSGNVTGTHLVWQVEHHSPFISSPVLYQGLLYMVDDQSGHLSVFEPETGELVYREQFTEGMFPRVGRVDIYASLVAVDGKVFIMAEDGRTFVIKAGREFELLHVNRLSGPVYASPALLDGEWYWRTTSELIRIAAAKD